MVSLQLDPQKPGWTAPRLNQACRANDPLKWSRGADLVVPRSNTRCTNLLHVRLVRGHPEAAESLPGQGIPHTMGTSHTNPRGRGSPVCMGLRVPCLKESILT